MMPIRAGTPKSLTNKTSCREVVSPRETLATLPRLRHEGWAVSK